jgi:hypothetical protein
MNVNHHSAGLAHRGSQIFHVLDDILLFCVGRRAGRGERAAFDNDVILQVLNDQRRPFRIELSISHGSP